MKYFKQIGIVFGLLGLLFLVNYPVEAGRPIYLSDFFDQGTGGEIRAYYSGDTEVFDHIVVKLTQVNGEIREYQYKYLAEYQDPDSTAVWEPFFVCRLVTGEYIEIQQWLDIDLSTNVSDGVIICDREPTQKYIDFPNYDYAFYLQWNRKGTFNGYPAYLNIFLYDKNSPPIIRKKPYGESISTYTMAPGEGIIRFEILGDENQRLITYIRDDTLLDQQP